MTDGDDYIVASVVTFEDGTESVMPLHRGSRKECERVFDLVPAISYSGTKPARAARLAIMPAKEWIEEGP